MQDEKMSSRAAWSSYWSSGALHSCAGSFTGNYGGCIADFWRQWLPDIGRGERLLDLATGNGALPRLILEALPAEANLRIDAVDLARVAPEWTAQEREQRLHFHAGIRMEQLPFDPNVFDRIVSQFGIEYADEAAAVSEVLRVARSEACFAFVIHHADSVLVRVASAEVQHIERLLDEDGILAAAEQALPWIGAARAGANLEGERSATAARLAYNRAAQRLQAAIDDAFAPDLLWQALQEMPKLLGSVRGAEISSQLQLLQRWRAALQASQQRSLDLLACARSEARIGDFVARFVAARPQLTACVEPLQQAEGLLGWGVVLR